MWRTGHPTIHLLIPSIRESIEKSIAEELKQEAAVLYIHHILGTGLTRHLRQGNVRGSLLRDRTQNILDLLPQIIEIFRHRFKRISFVLRDFLSIKYFCTLNWSQLTTISRSSQSIQDFFRPEKLSCKVIHMRTFILECIVRPREPWDICKWDTLQSDDNMPLKPCSLQRFWFDQIRKC